MSELSDEDLRDLLSQWRSEPPVFEVIEDCLALRARVAQLEAALERILDRAGPGDNSLALDECATTARAALKGDK